MKIHILSTINGLTNEGMRNVATHLGLAFEEHHSVCYSKLHHPVSALIHTLRCEITFLFVRANRQTYFLAWFLSRFCKNIWFVCVQQPDNQFQALVNKHPLPINYLALLEKDLAQIAVLPHFHKNYFSPGMDTTKFQPIDRAVQMKLKQKYGFHPDLPLLVHVGHCSSGRGLEDFAQLTGVQKLVVCSGLFETPATVRILQENGVKLYRGYLEHIEEIYQMADVYFFPTRSTEFVISIPLSVLESLACGTPVLGYAEFANWAAIPAQPGAIQQVASSTDLNAVLSHVLSRKTQHSLLQQVSTWDEVAAQILALVGRCTHA